AQCDGNRSFGGVLADHVLVELIHDLTRSHFVELRFVLNVTGKINDHDDALGPLGFSPRSLPEIITLRLSDLNLCRCRFRRRSSSPLPRWPAPASRCDAEALGLRRWRMGLRSLLPPLRRRARLRLRRRKGPGTSFHPRRSASLRGAEGTYPSAIPFRALLRLVGADHETVRAWLRNE